MSSEAVVNLEDIISGHESDCSSALEAFKRDLQKVRTGRASAGLVENLSVEHYGAKTQLCHLGTISTPEARLILIQVFDAGAVSAIEKAIQTSGLGLNPSVEGNVVRISVPVLTEEGRREIVKVLNRSAEDIKVSIRSHRRDANDKIKKAEKDGSATKDDVKKLMERVQTQTDGAIKAVDENLKAKEAECMEV